METNKPAGPSAVCGSCGKALELSSQEGSLEQRIQQLEAENARLTDAARRFGDLAERLNEQLREERRRAFDRRQPGPRNRGFGAPTE